MISTTETEEEMFIDLAAALWLMCSLIAFGAASFATSKFGDLANRSAAERFGIVVICAALGPISLGMILGDMSKEKKATAE